MEMRKEILMGVLCPCVRACVCERTAMCNLPKKKETAIFNLLSIEAICNQPQAQLNNSGLILYLFNEKRGKKIISRNFNRSNY